MLLPAAGCVVLALVVVVLLLLQEPKMRLQRLEEQEHNGTFPAGPCCFQPLLLDVWILWLVVDRVVVVADAATAVPERHDHTRAVVVHHGWQVLLVCFPQTKKNKDDTPPPSPPKAILVILVLVVVVVLVEKFHMPCILVGFVNTRILFLVPEAGIGPHHQWFSIEVVIVRLL